VERQKRTYAQELSGNGSNWFVWNGWLEPTYLALVFHELDEAMTWGRCEICGIDSTVIRLISATY
jgi:hypothetical protein